MNIRNGVPTHRIATVFAALLFMLGCNLAQAVVLSDDRRIAVKLDDGTELPCPASRTIEGPALMLLRPEDIHADANGNDKSGMQATIEDLVYLGQTTRVHLRTETGMSAIAALSGIRALEKGQQVQLSWDPEHAWLLPAN